jgi:uncharacterized protein
MKCPIDRSITTEALATATAYEASGGAFRNPLSRPRTLELVAGRGELRAADELFEPEARSGHG